MSSTGDHDIFHDLWNTCGRKTAIISYISSQLTPAGVTVWLHAIYWSFKDFFLQILKMRQKNGQEVPSNFLNLKAGVQSWSSNIPVKSNKQNIKCNIQFATINFARKTEINFVHVRSFFSWIFFMFMFPNKNMSRMQHTRVLWLCLDK